MAEFAVVVPIGPREEEVERVRDLLASLSCYESGLKWFVMIDDSLAERSLTSRIRVPAGCSAVSLKNPRMGRGNGYYGGMAAGVLSALEWLEKNVVADFVLKMDTDCLVIAPFSNMVEQTLTACPGIGIAGTRGRTCDRGSEGFRSEMHTLSPIIKAQHQWRRYARRHTAVECVPGDTLTPAQLAIFERVAPDIECAERNGYFNLDYCQGGGYVVSSEMLKRMAARHHFSTALDWIDMPFGEDVIMGMYAYAVGLDLQDLSDEGQPFGVHWQGLAFSPGELAARGHALIHSVKNDPRYPETAVRRYFSGVRGWRARNRHAAGPEIRDTPSGEGPPFLYAATTTAQVLHSPIAKTLLLGSFVGRLNFGDISQLQSNLTSHQMARPAESVIPVLSLSHVFTRERLKRAREIGDTTNLLILSRAALPEYALRNLHLEPVSEIHGVETLHCYGDVLNPFWDDRGISLVESLVGRFNPRRYIISGQQIGAEYVSTFAEHVRKYKPRMVGCRDIESVRILCDAGVDAAYSGDDAIDLFLQHLDPPELQCRGARDGSFALQLSLPPRVLAVANSTNPLHAKQCIVQINAALNHLQSQYGRSGNAPLLVNASIDSADLHDTWSSLRRTSFGLLFPCASMLDLTALGMRWKLAEAAGIIHRLRINRFIGTLYHPTLYFKCLGVTSFLMAFNGYHRQNAASLQQGCATVGEFLATPTGKLREEHAAFLLHQRLARKTWQAELMNA